MTKLNSSDYCGSFTDDDSGVGLDYSSSTSTLIESSPSHSSLSRVVPVYPPPPPPPPSSHPVQLPITTIKKRNDAVPLVKYTSDGIVERIRPSTMKNSQNGDYILCQTDRGTYVAYRTPAVPQWVTELVEEIERQQR